MAQTDERRTASLSDRYPMRQQRVGDDKSTGLTVAVTGPTGEIGISAVTALEQDPTVERIIGMARQPFDPASHGWTKTTYQQGDIMDRDAVDALVAAGDAKKPRRALFRGGGPRGIMDNYAATGINRRERGTRSNANVRSAESMNTGSSTTPPGQQAKTSRGFWWSGRSQRVASRPP